MTGPSPCPTRHGAGASLARGTAYSRNDEGAHLRAQDGLLRGWCGWGGACQPWGCYRCDSNEPVATCTDFRQICGEKFWNGSSWGFCRKVPVEPGPPSIWHSDPVSATRADVGQDVLAETLAVAAGLVGGPLRAVGEPFPGSRRTLVVRTVDPSGRSFVVKRYLSDEGREAYAREASALEALTGVAQTPTLVAESSDPRLVVMGDLGDGTHLADALLGDDADRASTTLSGWATAVAGLHRAGHQVREAF